VLARDRCIRSDIAVQRDFGDAKPTPRLKSHDIAAFKS
jgi:hypothetical protein